MITESAAVRSPDAMDFHIGARIRSRREGIGMGLGRLAEKLGITFHQVMKYERGINRISCSRLYEVATILDVSITYFFDDLPPEMDRPALRHDMPSAEAGEGVTDLLRAYFRIVDPQMRRQVLMLIRSMAPAASGGETSSV
jgi:transcriptional regulator with XRE-family HTH domain